MQESTQSMAVGVNPLAGFAFEKHGADEEHFRALADLSFISRGENVLILGGIGSGKTTLANILLKQATDSGLILSKRSALLVLMPTERIGSWLDWWSIAHAVLLYRGLLQDNGRPVYCCICLALAIALLSTSLTSWSHICHALTGCPSGTS